MSQLLLNMRRPANQAPPHDHDSNYATAGSFCSDDDTTGNLWSSLRTICTLQNTAHALFPGEHRQIRNSGDFKNFLPLCSRIGIWPCFTPTSLSWISSRAMVWDKDLANLPKRSRTGAGTKRPAFPLGGGCATSTIKQPGAFPQHNASPEMQQNLED